MLFVSNSLSTLKVVLELIIYNEIVIKDTFYLRNEYNKNINLIVINQIYI